MRVLIVTGNTDLEELLATSLPLHGLVVSSADRAAEAARLAAGQEAAVVVFDIERDAEWDECADLVRTLQAPVIAFTGWIAADARFRRRALEIGCAAFVVKPCAADVLASVVARVAAGERGIEIVSSQIRPGRS